MVAENNLMRDECLEKLKRFYDGYKFSEKCKNLYNPYSLINNSRQIRGFLVFKDCLSKSRETVYFVRLDCRKILLHFLSP